MSFEGYKQINFDVNGRSCIIVCPKEAKDGNLWVWKTEFFEAFNYAERKLLEDGFFLAYHCVSDMYGCPQSVTMMKEFYDVAVNEYGLNAKPALFGFSRGGLYASNFALTYPDCVGMLYLDAPVLDIRSWPGGKGSGCGEESCWEECKACYGLDEESAKSFDKNPLDRTEELAKTGIPVLITCGAVDKVVPYAENGKPFYERFKKAGGKISRIVKPYCDHHPHSLFEPTPICEYVKACYGLASSEAFSPKEISLNSAKTVAYGDSITYGAYTAEGDDCPASRSEKRWIELVCERFGINDLINYGESGISISATSNVQTERALILQYTRMEDASLVFIACGTNDFGTNVVLGTPDDKEDGTFYGAVNALCRGLKEKYPNSGIIFVTPISRMNEDKNEIGLSLNDYRNAIIEVAANRYGFTVIRGDKFDMDANDEAFRKKYMLDGTHPNPQAQVIYANGVISQIEKGEGLL